MDVEEIIKIIEDLPDGIYVDYDQDLTSCTITFDATDYSVVVSTSIFTVESRLKKSPLELADGYLQIRKEISGTPARKLLLE